MKDTKPTPATDPDATLATLAIDERAHAAAVLDQASRTIAVQAIAAELDLPPGDPVVAGVLGLRHQVRLARSNGQGWESIRGWLVTTIIHATGSPWGIPVTDGAALLRGDAADRVIEIVRDPRQVAARLHRERNAAQAERDAARAVRERGELLVTLQARAADRGLDGSSRRSAARELSAMVPELGAAALAALDAEQRAAEEHAARREASVRAADAEVNAERREKIDAARARADELGALGS